MSLNFWYVNMRLLAADGFSPQFYTFLFVDLTEISFVESSWGSFCEHLIQHFLVVVISNRYKIIVHQTVLSIADLPAG